MDEDGCQVLNPSAFAQEFSFASYSPATHQVTFAAIGDSYEKVNEEEDESEPADDQMEVVEEEGQEDVPEEEEDAMEEGDVPEEEESAIEASGEESGEEEERTRVTLDDDDIAE